MSAMPIVLVQTPQRGVPVLSANENVLNVEDDLARARVQCVAGVSEAGAIEHDGGHRALVLLVDGQIENYYLQAPWR